MTRWTENKVVVVTGAGQGLGRAEALAFAENGAHLVVNDIRRSAASALAAEINAAGGSAVANDNDVSDWDGARVLVEFAIEAFGGLDVLVNNAGILRDVPFVDLELGEWQRLLDVHLNGTFAPTKHAVRYWIGQAVNGPVDARVINTSSPSGLYATVNQTHYGMAKAGIATLTQILAQELGPHGIAVNALSPTAMTAMTAERQGYLDRLAEVEEKTGWNPGSPDNVAALAVWLASDASHGVTGNVFNIRGGHVSIAEGWRIGPSAEQVGDWSVETLGSLMPDLLARSTPMHDAYGVQKGPFEVAADR